MIIEKKSCEKCKHQFASLVNGELCIKCYQARYYQNVTKKKRKNKRKNKSTAWWMHP